MYDGMWHDCNWLEWLQSFELYNVQMYKIMYGKPNSNKFMYGISIWTDSWLDECHW